MPKFILVYHGGREPMDDAEADRQKKRYMDWMEGVGSALVSPMNPFGPSKMVRADGVEETPKGEALTGYSVLEVDTLDEAVDIAKSCPFLDIGSLEVAPLIEMPQGG